MKRSPSTPGRAVHTPARASETECDPRWAAVVARDRNSDGRFFYSVRTTGVYCRPSCGSRLARPENVRFHATRDEAEQAGFRPCRRCRPDEMAAAQRQAKRIARACRLIESGESAPDLASLAGLVGLSPAHFHRLFKATTGLTPREYAAAHRRKRARAALDRELRVTDAVFAAGFGSTGRFYENADGVLGMTPTAWRRGGEGTTIRFALGECSLGHVLVAQSARGICAISLGDDPQTLLHEFEDRFPAATLVGGDQVFERTVARVVALVETPRTGLDLPLDIRGTAFQQRVWKALQKIPAGQTVSYAELARRIGAPRAVRAVAGACASNALAVAIPCHRVVRSDGTLSGYRWGVERKRALLAREAVAD